MLPSRSDGLDFARKLPVLFVCSIIVFLFIAYSVFHCLPLLQLDVPAKYRIQSDVIAGTWQLAVFMLITALLLACYVRSIVEPAGGIPDTPEWMAGMASESAELPANVQETKGDGGRRKCKWCAKYKPDRCHHCRVCRACVLKMDHHCPWIYNCVGFSNHKYFFLLLLYSVIDTHLIAWTMWMTVQKTTQRETSFGMMFLVLFAESLASFLAIITTLFLGFHIWLMMNAMTTIEYCEKTLKKENYNQSAWDLGFTGNLKAVFGPHVMLWFLPLSPPTGDGINYVNEGSRLTIDLENGRGLRRQHIQERRRRRKRSSDEEDLVTLRQDERLSTRSIAEASSSLRPVPSSIDNSAPSDKLLQ